MSPEQAKGRQVDKRADIWAFGVVLFEMLTGRRPFHGGTTSDTLAATLTQEPDWDGVPSSARRLLQRCLDKDPRKRLRDIGEAPFLMEDAVSGVSHHQTASASPATRVPWIVAAMLAVALAGSLFAPWRGPAAEDPSLMRFTMDTGPTDIIGPTMAISADGTRVAYRAPNPNGFPWLVTRLLSETTATVLAGTEGAYNPFFSPDGEWIAFFSFSTSKIMKVPVQGGVPVALADASIGRGGSWGEDGTIVAELDPFSGSWRLSDQGGPPARLTRPSRDRHAWPQFLPGGRAIIYSAGPHGVMENGRIEALSLGGGEPTTVLQGGYQARYLPTSETQGHLVYVRSGVLYAVPFDPMLLEVLGEPVQILDDVASTASHFGAAVAHSSAGTFVYASGRAAQRWPLAWSDSSGTVEPLALEPDAYYTPRLSPEGDRVALSVDSDRGQDVFVYDISRDTRTRLTTTGEANLWPVWAPDGEHLVFTSLTGEQGTLWWVRADGTSQPERLYTSQNAIRQIAISPDGRYVGYTEQDPDTGGDLWILPLDHGSSDTPTAGEPRPVLQTSSSEGVPAFSPDGRWLAYTSNELGAYNVWVQRFPELSGKWQVSVGGGGGYSFWSRTAPELFYYGGAGAFLVEYDVEGDRFIPGRPTRWPTPTLSPMPIGFEALDLAPDGKRFLVLPNVEPDAPGAPGQVTFLLNFFEELQARVPTGR